MATWGTPISLRGGKGDAGLSVLSGVGAPDDGLGYDTQSYISDVGDLYFKANGTWAKQRSLVGQSGMNGLNAQLLHGVNPPDENTFSNDADAIYLQDGGEVWFFDFEGTKTWTDAGYSLRGIKGEAGAAGKDGLRGTQTYIVSGAPSNDLTSFIPQAQSGDLAYDTATSGGPYLYVLGA